MENANFFDEEMHRIIKNQPGAVHIKILDNPDEESYHRTTEFMIGEAQMRADASPDVLVNYLLEPLLEHHPHPVTINGHPIERLEFKPQTSTSYSLMPRPTEGSYTERQNEFAGHRDAGIIIDGVTYLPTHPQWAYNIIDRHSPHEHWSSLTQISAYPLIDLGNPVHSDPSHPENVAEALSISLKPEYQVYDWMQRHNCPDTKDVYDSWTPLQARNKQHLHWALKPMPIAVHGTPAIIDVPNQALAYSIAHALYNQPELGLVPVTEPKDDRRHVTVTCPEPGNITIVDAEGNTHRAGDGLPNPDGTVGAITIICQADGEDITVNANFLFADELTELHHKATIYATGRHNAMDTQRGDVPTISLMAANAFMEPHRSLSPEHLEHQAIQAIEGTEQAIENLMYETMGHMNWALDRLSKHHGDIKAESARWTISYKPDPNPDETS